MGVLRGRITAPLLICTVSLILSFGARTCLGQRERQDRNPVQDQDFYDENYEQSDVGIFEAPSVRVKGKVVKVSQKSR